MGALCNSRALAERRGKTEECRWKAGSGAHCSAWPLPQPSMLVSRFRSQLQLVADLIEQLLRLLRMAAHIPFVRGLRSVDPPTPQPWLPLRESMSSFLSPNDIVDPWLQRDL
jgi:hypothetical protein